MEDTKKTCLHDLHTALGAQMSPFAGYDMPIQYSGIEAEHRAVRQGCGVFDVSHMGEINISGPDAERCVNHIFTNDVAGAPAGQCFYGMMLHPHGGVVDDLLVYKRAPDSFLLVVNAANILKDEAWVLRHSERFNVTVDFLSEELSELAIQGPLAERVVEEVLGLPCADLAFYTFKELDTPGDGTHIILSRTGYTGEDGFELYAPRQYIRRAWQLLIGSGRCEPCGLGCRDTLRFEVGLPLYGDELADDITPVEAGLSMFVKTGKPDLIGGDAVAAQKAQGPARRLVGLELLDRAVPRHGYEVLAADEDRVVGTVTTGYRGISVDKSVAMALVDASVAAKGTPLRVRVRRKVFPAVVVPRKFYKKSYKN